MALPPPGLPSTVWRHLNLECVDPAACKLYSHHELAVVGTHELAQTRKRSRELPLNQADRRELIRRYSEGESEADLATRFAISLDAVRRVIRRV